MMAGKFVATVRQVFGSRSSLLAPIGITVPGITSPPATQSLPHTAASSMCRYDTTVLCRFMRVPRSEWKHQRRVASSLHRAYTSSYDTSQTDRAEGMSKDVNQVSIFSKPMHVFER